MSKADQVQSADIHHENLPSSVLRAFVLHWNSPEECTRTVCELQSQGVPLRITVIDNGSELSNLQALSRNLLAPVELHRLEKNLGWGAALNIALRPWVESGPEDYCVLCAHDALPAPKCLVLIVEAMNADPLLGLACPDYGSGEVVLLSAFKGVHFGHAAPGPEGSVLQVAAPYGALVVVRRQCLQTIGMFDERFFAYIDDPELGFRASRGGWKSGLVWGARVVNPGTTSPEYLRAYLFARNNILAVRLYLGPVAALARAAITLCSCMKPYWWARQDGHRLIFARLRGIFDYFTGRFGPPPVKYLEWKCPEMLSHPLDSRRESTKAER